MGGIDGVDSCIDPTIALIGIWHETCLGGELEEVGQIAVDHFVELLPQVLLVPPQVVAQHLRWEG